MSDFNWRCPFCDHHAAITERRRHNSQTRLTIENAEGSRWFSIFIVVCPNQECRRFTLTLTMHEVEDNLAGGYDFGKLLKRWNLIPAAQMRVLPKYVPKPIVQDYEEACLIAESSPKASATLARRCLQGMIRDFWGIAKGKLSQEIDAIQDKVDPLTWTAIDGTARSAISALTWRRTSTSLLRLIPTRRGT